MARWYGLGGSWISDGLPHYIALDRKPDAGCEIHDTCCSESGLICQIELVKEPQSDEFATTDAPKKPPITNMSGINVAFCLTKLWHHTRRIVVGNLAFSSVNTCVQMDKAGLGYIGVVKNATKYFPMAALQRVILPRKGNFVGMTTKADGTTIASYVWCDRKRRYFVASAGSLADGEPWTRIRRRETGDGSGNRQTNDVFISIPMPVATEMYYSAANKIDMHNKVRAECGIDHRLKTNDWATRVNFGILGMLFTDAYLLYKGCRGVNAKLSPKLFFAQLADCLIDISIPNSQGKLTRGQKRSRRI